MKYFLLINKKNVFIIKIFILYILTIMIYITLNINLIIQIYSIDESKNIEAFLKKCNNSDIKDLYFFKKKRILKVSIVSPIFNRSKYLLRFIKSIQNQYFKDIEIILIDDFSPDNTVNLIKQLQTIDKRITLIRNKKNFGTFKSRNIGIVKSRGEYIILPDPDDILSHYNLKMFYYFAKKYDYETIRYNLYMGEKRVYFSEIMSKIPTRPVFQPELQTFLFYATGELKYADHNIANKLIKREVLIRALDMLPKEYLNNYMTTFEDQLLNYIIHRNAKSYCFLDKIGYYYIKNPDSITKQGFLTKSIKDVFELLKFVFNFSRNNLHEKNMFNVIFEDFVIQTNISDRITSIKDNKKFYLNAIDSFLYNDFISINNKKYMIKLKKKIIKSH